MSSFSSRLRQVICEMRQAHPGWGAKTLRAELCQDGRWREEALPSVASIARLLKAKGLTRRYERHSPLPSPPMLESEAIHEVWEMDAKGYQQLETVGYISLINLNDRASHVRLLSYPCQVGRQRWQRHPNTEDYQCALRLAFTQWGLPKRLQVDHGSVFIDNRSPSPFPTRLHLWLLALDVQLQFGRVGQPRDQAITERSHQLWEAQCLQGQVYQDWSHLYQSLQQRRQFLNEHLPCRTLHEQPPLTAFPQAVHSSRSYRPEWESQTLDLQRVWDYLAHSRWYRLVASGGTVTLGQQVYHVGQSWARQDVEITFEAEQQHFLFHDDTGQLIVSRPILGISIDQVMGQLADHFNLPHFQLALPFDGHAHTVTRLFDTLGA